MGFADAAEIVGDRLRGDLHQLWPAPTGVDPAGPISLAEIVDRYAEAGTVLREFRRGTAAGVWPHLDRATLARDLHRRVMDPALMRQRHTGFCGPMSVLFELGRRDPAQYLRTATELFETGSFVTPTLRRIRAEAELRDVVPDPDMAQADWMLAATMRDDENDFEDVEADATGWEALTWTWEVKRWIEDLLGLAGDVDACETAGEHDALAAGDAAVRSGGVAILCIDSNLLLHTAGDDEENIFWSSREHLSPGSLTDASDVARSRDDGYFPNHYVALLEPVRWGGDFRARVWSWGCEYTLIGDPESLFEYLYYVVIGRPR